MYVCMHVCVYVTYVCMYVCMYAYVVCIQCFPRVQRLTHAGDWSLLSLALNIALKVTGFISQPANNIPARKSTAPQTKCGCGMVLNQVGTN